VPVDDSERREATSTASCETGGRAGPARLAQAEEVNDNTESAATMKVFMIKDAIKRQVYQVNVSMQ
jgi:hypothetical protein